MPEKYKWLTTVHGDTLLPRTELNALTMVATDGIRRTQLDGGTLSLDTDYVDNHCYGMLVQEGVGPADHGDSPGPTPVIPVSPDGEIPTGAFYTVEGETDKYPED